MIVESRQERDLEFVRQNGGDESSHPLLGVYARPLMVEYVQNLFNNHKTLPVVGKIFAKSAL